MQGVTCGGLASTKTCVEVPVKSHLSHQSVKYALAVAPLHPWVWSINSFCKFINGKDVLHHCRCPFQVARSIQDVKHNCCHQLLLSDMFSAYGLPEQVVSTIGPQFTSADFTEFMKGNGIKHICSAPYHSLSNRRICSNFKQDMKAGKH